MTELKVNLTKTINAPIESVFEAWLNPEILSQFMLPMPGMPAPRTEVDAQENGGFTIWMQVGDKEIPHTGKYLEISHPNKLVFTWESPSSTDDSIVTLIFSAKNDKQTRIDLTQIKFIDEQSRTNHQGGWTNILQSLENLLSN